MTAPFDTLTGRLGEQVRAAQARLHIPGAAVAVLHGGKRYAAGFGVTNVDHPLPVDADTLFSIGSITKTFTATALLRLLPEAPSLAALPPPLGGPDGFAKGQRLDLDAPVRTYVPDLRLADEGVAARVTTRHLLTHTGGWVGRPTRWEGPRDYSRDAIARAIPKLEQLPQVAPPGRVFSYSNTGYLLAGRVLEALTGRPYDVAVSRLVLEPLGMTRATFFARWAVTHRVAVPHATSAAGATVDRSVPWGINPIFNPAGGLAATANELLRFAELHLGDGAAPDGAPLLAAGVLRAMRTPHVAADGAGTGVGLGWLVRDVDGVRVASHNGHLGTSISYLTVVPERRFAFVVLSNAGPARLDVETTRWALEQFAGLVTPPVLTYHRAVDELREYAGRFTGVRGHFDLAVGVADGGLAVRRLPKDGASPGAAPPERFLFCGPDALVPADAPDASRCDFVRDPAGVVTWFRYNSDLYPRDTGPSPTPEAGAAGR